jgi:hypothetical protein
MSQCSVPCPTLLSSCDDIWLPHFEFINVRGFSQDRVVRYGIRSGPNDSVACWAHVQVSTRSCPAISHAAPAACGRRTKVVAPLLVLIEACCTAALLPQGEFYTPLQFRSFPFDK